MRIPSQAFAIKALLALGLMPAFGQTVSFESPLVQQADTIVGPPPQLLDDSCIVSVLNRSASVNPDGTWILPNVPANFGPVRARATCVRNGSTVFGQSDLFTLAADQSVTLPDIVLGNTSPIPLSIAVTAPASVLNQASQTTQLTAIATFATGPQDVTAASTGTQYHVSNAAIATVSPDGLVTAVGSGTAVIQAQYEGAQGLFTIQVVLSVDSDGDGIPDDAELRLGLNPHDPTDALLDLDHDGLTNLQEYQLGTDPRNPDTDGDGLTDGQEVLLYHTNPLVASTDGTGIPDGIEVQNGTLGGSVSAKFASAVASIEVQPSNFTLTVNSITSQASQQLTVTGHLIDNVTTVDLTSTTKGTNYGSSDLTICNFGSPDGAVFAGNTGFCTITVTNGGHSATAIGTVTGFSPLPLSWIAIPGSANSVDVNGNFAYVAAGSTGLQVVDVTDRVNPRIVTALATPGNANNIKVVGNTVYLADGSSGLQIIDATNPLAPALLGGVNTPGIAWDVVVAAGIAYVASDTSGLTLIDVSSSAHPFVLSSLPLSGTTKGADIDIVRKVAVAVGTAGLFTVDVSNPSAPALLGSVNYGGDPRHVALKGNLAVVADVSKSLSAVNVAAPTAPVYSGSTDVSLGGVLQSVTIFGNFALAGPLNFLNTSVSITDISDPPNLLSRAILTFPTGGSSGFRKDFPSGIAADSQYVYMTAGQSSAETAATGDTRLYIGQYFSGQNVSSIDHTPPTATIVSPVSGSTVIQGSQLQITAQAADDQAVAGVNFSVNGQLVFVATSSPYQFIYVVPTNVTTLTIGAQAVDYGSNTGSASPVTINVIPDPLTTAHGQVVDPQNNPISGASIACQNNTAVSGADGSFSVTGLSTIQGAIQCTSTTSSGTAKSFEFAPVRGGTTELGLIVMSTSRSRGRDFWVTCPFGGYTTGLASTSSSCELFIVTDGSANYTVTVDPSFNFGASGTVTAQSPAVVNIPSALPPGCVFNCTSGLQLNSNAGIPAGVENKGIHVSADADVSVFVFIPLVAAGADMYLAIPSISLGKDYYPILAMGQNSDQQLGVTAIQDNTHVTIARLCSSFSTYTIPYTSPALNAGQTVEVGCGLNDMSTAHVTSDQPVSVVVGVQLPFLQAPGPTGPIVATGSLGPITEMMLPGDSPAWGTEIYAAPLPVGPADYYEIRASQDGTTVTVDQGSGKTQTFTVNQGNPVSLQFKSAARFTSDKPILVAQYSTCSAGCLGELGGSEEMQLLPITDFGTSFRFYTPADDPVAVAQKVVLWTRYAIVISPNSGVGSVQLNGNPVNGFIALPGGTYQYAIVPVPQGQSVVTSAQPITVYSVGFMGNGAYGTATSF